MNKSTWISPPPNRKRAGYLFKGTCSFFCMHVACLYHIVLDYSQTLSPIYYLKIVLLLLIHARQS